MKPYYQDQAHVDQFQENALRWTGVPFRENTACVKAGIDCARLQYALHHAAGALPQLEIPVARMDHHWHNADSKILEFIKSLKSVEGVTLRTVRKDSELMPGDVVLLRWGRCEHHITSYYGFNKLIHVAYGGYVCFQQLSDKRLAGLISKRMRFYI